MSVQQTLEKALGSCGTDPPRTGDRQVVHGLITEALAELREMPEGEQRRGWATSVSDLISSVRVEHGPGHDRVHIWNRGGKAGVLTVKKGDGDNLALILHERKEGDDG
ncbi:MAG: hypothetical protein V3T08_09325 [Gemmatimonadota bacterium]